MKLYNTLTRQTDEFQPQDGSTVGMYVCGPTVYDHIHIGNVRPVIVFDTLRRYFETFKGWNVVHVQNITDIDDKLINKSIETGETVESIAATYTGAFFELLQALGVLQPTHTPLATEHVDGMIQLIESLVQSGHAYEKDGDVYFRVDSFEDYGKLSGRRLEEQEAGARIEASSHKENPFDFTLWKAAKPGEPKWDSPWGEGRPGWHTECVVLSNQYLGEHRDIHAGGNDLVFPHHENEIAQAEASSGKPFFRFWLHNGMLSIGGQKMSKSLGNFDYAKNVLANYDPETVRYFYLSRHYRKPLDYSDEGLQAAQTAVTRLRTMLTDVESELRNASGTYGDPGIDFVSSLAEFRSRYVEAMDDDLNTVAAISVLQDLVSATNQYKAESTDEDRMALLDAVALLKELGEPLGLFAATASRESGLEDGLMTLLIELRKQLREKREFKLADQIRDHLAELGVVLKDTAQGTIWSLS
ncbi:cysteine--tRNA ligase [Candidatus Bipolaricaulota bacterium]|nr:cysteine--tRNA ligase [Candidatus Bipolaricaulota bacterium]TFH09788.1 MAG: cysteine--tRNA ligase [Candidatus Atribacteria bacterium]